jgi:hypothetical protein
MTYISIVFVKNFKKNNDHDLKKGLNFSLLFFIDIKHQLWLELVFPKGEGNAVSNLNQFTNPSLPHHAIKIYSLHSHFSVWMHLTINFTKAAH